MPVTITSRILSGSTHGVGIAVTATQGVAPNVIHQLGTSATTTLDKLYLYANNNYSGNVDIVLEIGTSQSGLQIINTVQSRQGAFPIIEGLLLTGSACGISCFVAGLNGSASPAISGSSLISIYGYVQRIVQT